MADKHLLRNRTAVTRLLVLAALHEEPGTTLSRVARGLDVTVQAVSTYAREMAQTGHLRVEGSTYHVTPRGIQELHEGVRHLRESIDDLAAPLADIYVVSAIATAPITAGDQVGLYMDAGDLAANPKHQGPSQGRAQHDAQPGDEVVVDDLHGIVELEPGRLTLVTLPGPEDGGTRRVHQARLKKLLAGRDKPDKIGAHGTGAHVLAQQITPHIDFAFAAHHAAFNAAERGLNVLLFVSRDLIPDVMHAFDRLNDETLHRVPVDILEAPEHHP